MWWNEINDKTWRHKNSMVYLHLWCGALQQRRPCAQRWPWPDCAEARNLLGSLHLLCFPLTHLTIGHWDRKKKMGRKRRERTLVSLPPPFSPLFSLTPVAMSPLCPSHPPIPPSFLTVFICRDFCCVSVFLISLSPSFLFSLRRSRGRGEEGWKKGQVVRMREGRKNNRTEN